MIRRFRDLRRQEKGFVMILMGASMMALFLIAGFAVDLGNWYLSASRQQRAADAAALDGVAWTPNIAKATSIALQATKTNGYDDQSPSVTVTVTPIDDTDLDVEIVDTNVKTYFTATVLKSVTLKRHARATRTDGIKLGNPTNAFGLGDLSTTSDAKGAWATIDGWCNATEQGDQVATLREGNLASRTSGATTCNDPVSASDTNPNYNPNGHFYAVRVPAGRATPLELDLYDAGWYRGTRDASNQIVPVDGSADGPGQVWPADTDGVPTEFILRSPDSTPLDNTDNPIYGGCDQVFTPDDSSVFNKTITVANDPSGTHALRWTSFCTIPSAAAAGDYILQVSNMPAQSAISRKTWGTNDFAMILQPVGSTTLNICTAPTAGCPRIEPLDYMSINVPLASTEADVYLAEIPPSNSGKTVKVGLFDPGDGATYLQLLDPKGNPVDFKWNVPNDPLYGGPPVAVSGQQLDVSQDGTQVFPDRYGTKQFNDRMVVLWVTIPTTYYNTFASDGGWWSIRYICAVNPNPGTLRSDSTTWSIGLGGTPIHLVT